MPGLSTLRFITFKPALGDDCMYASKASFIARSVFCSALRRNWKLVDAMFALSTDRNSAKAAAIIATSETSATIRDAPRCAAAPRVFGRFGSSPYISLSTTLRTGICDVTVL
jgi:hypothetical protein